MPDRGKKFHEFALKSILFKGRSDWYFCYLKTERIAHVLHVLAGRSASAQLKDIAEYAGSLPGEIARMAGGEREPSGVLADLFSVLAEVRLAVTEGSLGDENAALLAREYEAVAERLVAGSHPSPFVGAEDFFTPDIAQYPIRLSQRSEHAPAPLPQAVKDIKGHSKGQKTGGDRMSLILDYIRMRRSASIKEIAAVVKGCSEKTIQRELNSLIEQGLVRRVGERRWSLYELA